MDALLTETSLSYAGPPPLLIAASSEAAMRRARETAFASGQRIGAELDIAEARDRLRRQASVSAIWIELDRDCGEVVESLLDDIEHLVDSRRFGAVVSITSDLIDTLGARVFDGQAHMVIDGDPVERAATLATATALARTAERASDIAKEPGAERLRQLSDEVSRIAATLARLSTVPAAASAEMRKPVEGDIPDVSVESVRSVIRARRLRGRFFDEELFADPAWDMLLDLLQAEIAQLRVPVSSLCIAAAVPATTGLRWLKSMTDKGLFVRRADPHDGRRVFVELAPEASVALRRYFAEVGHAAVI
ncbi:winged helix-turn-helix transcriptional regulator [Sphingomonas sabuli]|uniref:Winged helix-turn-helix transcriptional regulator n=1 Tax=Sphingomonas sabuli TaxID=2764186 RepID=A0A7G9L3J0_9SPHN|nr:MarR family winged helix-turn-helix transcriptional regulator [Sphingomonas sabuli]QNM83189.1 winged helix-turn-helix transcriptional regulator [Sphingomonas sabuli]